MEAPEAEFLYRGHEADVRAVSFLPQGRGLLSADGAGVLIVWTLDTRRAIRKWQAHSNVIYAADAIPSDPWCIISQGRDNVLRGWSGSEILDEAVETPKPVFELAINALNFCRFSWCFSDVTDKENLLLAFSNFNKPELIDVYDLRRRTYISRALDPQAKSGMCLCTKLFRRSSTPDILIMAAGYEDGSILIWDVKMKSILGRIEVSKEPDVQADGLEGVAAPAATEIASFSTEFDQEGHVKWMKTASLPAAGVSEIAIRGDGRILATAGWDSKIRIFALKKLKPLAVLTAHRDGVQCVAFAWRATDTQPTEGLSSMLATGSKDKRVALYKIY
ncbi:hypothetical protein SmJEL517_g05402 [Synchytrium microbalum]|uniref:ASTRA-associated protein 1 n=1 Tax=Synchytrium microbalum TaxID=1806994 RepID=A0A507C0V0_9FUNG|nr:uncharacterized protein SmJEL517_g05402 [Synchytrium microbalum]TPX31195.1 hypothetical protein SmJEL517_g05402 [Synchytrium microbalum]